MKKEYIIESEVENLRIIENAIDNLSGELSISNDSYGRILVATMEAVNNAIVHGNKADHTKNVEIIFESDREDLEISIIDEGEGFSPMEVPDPTRPENIENINGRGVFLMKNLADDISFNERGNEVRMKFKI